ncbi:hypothetical protein ACWEVD_00560 [Nocardia thailandica]
MSTHRSTTQTYATYIGNTAEIAHGDGVYMDMSIHAYSDYDGPDLNAVLRVSLGVPARTNETDLAAADADEAGMAAADAALIREGWQRLTDWDYETYGLRAEVAPH